MKLELRTYQKDGVRWLLGNRDAFGLGLLDEQGLGKTPQAVVAASSIGGRVLVLAPTSVIYNWAREFQRWSHRLMPQVITKGSQVIRDDVDTVIVSHGLILREQLWRQLTKKTWATCIVDEAHAFKNPRAKRTRALYSLMDGVDSISSACDRVWILSGTLTPNDPSELWTHLRGLTPERIAVGYDNAPGVKKTMNWQEFRSRFCKLTHSDFTPDGMRVIGARNIGELRERISGMFLRRMKKDHLDLPPISFGTTVLTPKKLPAELRAIEKKVLKEWVKLNPNDPSVIKVLMQALRDDTDSFSAWRRLCGEAKAETAGELIHDRHGHVPGKCIVFAHHSSVIAGVRKGLGHLNENCMEITGSTPPELRERTVRAFQTPGSAIKVLICNLVAGGVGITLTAADTVYFVEQSPVPGDNAQAVARAYRFGQERHVNVNFLALADSVDTVFAEICARKTEMQEQLWT